MFQEVFLDVDCCSNTARQQRNQRVAELRTQGYDCRCQTLYRVLDGKPVYILEAYQPEDIEVVPPPPNTRPQRCHPETPRRMPYFEVR